MVLSWDVHDAATGLGFHGAFVGRSWCCGTFPVLPLGASMVVCALPFHLWDIHVVSIGLPYTVFPRYTRGSSVVRPWCSHGTVMALPCNFQGSSMVLRSYCTWYALPWLVCTRALIDSIGSMGSSIREIHHGASMVHPWGFHCVSMVLPLRFDGAFIYYPLTK